MLTRACVLLPQAGYNMNPKPFFDNIFPTALFAFLGTFLSTFVVGGIVYQGGQMGICHPTGGLASLVFGSLISATDPVTVLAVFQALGVKADLFSMVFGESVMNDAVAIVLSRTLLSFKSVPADREHILLACVLFVKIFLGSLLIGFLYGALSAYVYKLAGMKHDEHGSMVYVECVMIVCFAWGAYYTAEALELSGIVAILFCGIVMAKYTVANLSSEAKGLTAKGFKCVALLAETFVFVYLGMAAFAYPVFKWEHVAMVGVAIVGCLIGRLHIYLFSFITNVCFRGPDSELPPISFTYMNVMWFSGLRGGVAFAIAAVGYQHQDFPADSLAIMQTTLVIALITIFLMGGSITDIAKSTGILEPKKDKDAKKQMPPSEYLKPTTFFDIIDKNYLRPLLTSAPKGFTVEDIMARYDTPSCRTAAITIQKSWRGNTPTVQGYRDRIKQLRILKDASKASVSTDEFKASMTTDQIDSLLKGNNVTSGHISMEDKVDDVRAKVRRLQLPHRPPRAARPR